MSAPGVFVADGATRFAVRAPLAEMVTLCLFETPDAPEILVPMTREGDLWQAELPMDLTGQYYGYRAAGAWSPDEGRWFDPAKFLVDPMATELDRRFHYDPLLGEYGAETAHLVPRARITGALPEVPPAPPHFAPGGLIYEVNVRAFTLHHPEVPPALRGTLAALAHPAILAHLKKLHVGAVELMPITAWIDERHLPPLGLANRWGYNPVALMALDPGLVPGGIAELRGTVAALHDAGIGVLLDLVFNHTGESDMEGPVLSLRGLDDACYARAPDGALINDTGCGNTLSFAYKPVRDLALAAMRHFVRHAGVDGFRFDLAPVMARGPGFDPHAPIFREIWQDPLLRDRVMIAEPWDIGPGGYALGEFPENWLEWNDRFRDDLRRFWRGDAGIGLLATRLAGSADLFGGECRSVNFLAAHDGFALADVVAYSGRHNWANGEQNQDGHGGEICWNNGAEGPSLDPEIRARRDADLRAMLACLFASTGTIMLTAGDEFGRSQGGNNNSYCQDMPLDWEARDHALEDHVAALSAARAAEPGAWANFPRDGEWLALDGAEMTPTSWEDPASDGFRFIAPPGSGHPGWRIARSLREARAGGV